MTHRSDELENHVETSEYQTFPGTETEEIVQDCAATSKRHLHLVYLCIGMLCVLQALLNITLRVAWKESEDLSFERDASCYKSWQRFSGSCYYVSSGRGSWYKGHQDCLERGAHLVIVNNRQEMDFVMTLARDPIAAWIGMTDLEKEGFWIWLDGTPVTRDRSYWARGQPDDAGGEDCGEIHALANFSGFNDYDCSTTRLRWICEKTPTPIEIKTLG